MPVPPLSNTFDTGLNNNDLISLANSDDGSPSAGDAFQVLIGAPVYSTTHAKSGSLAAKIDTSSPYTEAQVAWTGLGTITTSVWTRLYLYTSAYPSASLRLIRLRSVGNANSAFLVLQPAGKLQALNAAAAGQTAGTVNVALDQWVRIEFRVLPHSTAGEMEWWLYNTPEAAIEDFDDHVLVTNQALQSDTGQVAWLSPGSAGPVGFIGWYDDVAVSSTGQIGSSTPLYKVRPDADVVTTGWSTAPLFSKINDSSDSTVIQATAS